VSKQVSNILHKILCGLRMFCLERILLVLQIENCVMGIYIKLILMLGTIEGISEKGDNPHWRIKVGIKQVLN